MNVQGSPFKFLDSFTKEDQAIFFGREKETSELYQKVFESKILLVYGITGTGKTSLINCGLANKFNDSDWLPVYIRRNQDIIQSIINALLQHSYDKPKASQDIKSILKLIQSVYLDNFKPVYLLFDQFEELFIFGSKEERESLIQLIDTIIHSDIQCKCIFILREEFLANITEFEKIIPDFFQNRIRIEKMSPVNALNTIKGPCKAMNIELEDQAAEKILDKVSKDHPHVELTYMQVLLDKVFETAKDHSKNGISITKEVVDKIGDVQDILGDFLEQQIRTFDNPDEVLNILKSFVSVHGTKKQVSQEEIIHQLKTMRKSLQEEGLPRILEKLVNKRILKEKDEHGKYELIHDALAEKVYEKITLVEKEMIEIREFITNAFHNYQKRGVFLSNHDLSYIAPYRDKLFLTKTENDFIEKSEKEQAKRKIRRRNITIGFTVLIVLTLAGFSFWALSEKDKANTEKQRATALYYNSLSKEVAKEDPTKAIRLAEYAYTLQPQNNTIYQSILECYAGNSFYNTIINYRWPIYGFSVSPDGNSILTHSSRNAMYLWDLQGNLIKTLFTEDIVRAIDFSPDRKTILTGMQGGKLALYDLEGNRVQSFKGHTKSINAVSFSPDGTTILSGSKDKSVFLWNLKGEKLHVFKNHTKEISSVCFSPDGKKILSGSLDNTACIYHTSGQLIKQLKGHKMAVNSVAFSPDGTKILTCSDDHSAILWDINGHIIHRFDQHESTVLDVTFSPDSRHFLSSTDSRNIYLWNLSGELINEFKGHTKDVIKTCFHPGNNMFFSGSYDHTIRTWKLKENENRILKGQQKWITSTDVSKNSELILSASNDGKIVLYDKAGNVVRIIKRRGRKISFASFDDNDQKILAGYDNGWIEVCNLTGEKILEIKGHKDRINSIDFSPKRGFILSGSEDGWVCVWDTSGNLIFRGPSNLSVYSPEEESLIAVIGNGGALFDLNRNVLAYYRGHQDKINDIDFSPDGELIATGSYDKTMRIWDIKGNTLQIIKHDAVINSLCFSPDGKFILTGASDNKARLWDLNGNLRQVFTGHTMPISSVNFFPDGNDVLTGSHDNTVRIWNVKKTYKAFKNQFNYSKLTIQDKLNYGILNFETLYETTNEKALLEGADFYIEKHTTQPDTKDPYQYLDKARELAEKLLQINKNKALYYTKLYDIMSYYDNKKVDFNVEQKMNDIFTAILFLPEKERANASEYFYLYFNDLSIKLLESFQDSNLKKNYSQRLFTSYNNYALELLRNGQYKEALKFAKKGCKYKPDEGIIYTKLVLAYLYNDQYEKAKKILENHRYEIVNDVLFQEYILIRLKEFETFYELPPDYEKVRKLLNEDETTV